MRVDEILPKIERFFEDLLRKGLSTGIVIHGHGTGTLKKVVRDEVMPSSPYVRGFRPGRTEEGGDGVTVVSV